MTRRSGRPSSKARSTERGIAILVVLITLTLVTTVVAEFQYSSRVDLQLAYNARDELQAEYNALTALRMRALLLRESSEIERALGSLGDLLGQATGAPPGQGGSNSLPIGQMLEMIPVDCGLLSSVLRESSNDFEDEDEAELNEHGEVPSLFTGECEASSTSEHSKISLNVLASAGGAENVVAMLTRLLTDPRFERHFEEDDRNGTHAENAQELVSAIIDWVDRDRNQTPNNVSDEDRHYAYLRDPYQAKNAPFDSLDELQLVHGIDDELFDLLRDRVTIYTASEQIDLNTASQSQLLVGLLGSLQPGVTIEQANAGIVQLYYMLAEMRAAMMGMGMLNLQTLTSLIESAGLGALIDTNNLKNVFTDKSTSTWYTIEATGRAGNVQRKIRAVFQAGEGKFYYYRVE